jgi:uncharacterized protein (DUF1778 family)
MAELIHTITFRVREDTYRLLRQLAQLKRRKLSDVVRMLIEEIVQEDTHEDS